MTKNKLKPAESEVIVEKATLDLRAGAAELGRDLNSSGYIPGRLTIAFFSLALTFFVSMVDLPLPDGLPLHRAYLLDVIVNNWLPATALYLLVRLTPMHSLLRSSNVINRMVEFVGIVLLLYVPAHIFALFVEDQRATSLLTFPIIGDCTGLASVIAFFGVISVLLAAFLIVLTSFRLISRSVKLRGERVIAVPSFSLQEKLITTALLAVLMGFVLARFY